MYERENSVRFELEMKKKFLQKYVGFLREPPLHAFEDQFSFHYLRYFGKLLPLEDSYTDWLVERVRALPKFQRLTTKSYLNSHYLCPAADFQSFEGRTHFFHLLQFLVYVQDLDYRRDQLGTTSYRLCVFRVQDFVTYLDPTVRSTNYYQVQKVLRFFDALPQNSIIQSFSDTAFRSLVTIPELRLSKSTRNRWMVEVWIAEELFDYTYPFILPDLRKRKLKYAFEVQFYIIQTFSCIGVEKVFDVQAFFHRYPSAISHRTMTHIKREFLMWVETLEKSDLIEKQYKIIQKGQWYSVRQLTLENISEGFVLYEKILRFTS